MLCKAPNWLWHNDGVAVGIERFFLVLEDFVNRRSRDSAEVRRALASQQCVPGSIHEVLRYCHTSVTIKEAAIQAWLLGSGSFTFALLFSY